MSWVGLHVECSEEIRDMLLAECSTLPIRTLTFEERDTGLSAFVSSDEWSSVPFLAILNKYDVTTWREEEIPTVNWNEEWEKNYDPIAVNDQLIVRAPFHEKTAHPLEIIIQPQMSFGTGHHATTHLVLAYQLTLDHQDKLVMDVGCGTGVLAIMAKKRGASSVVAFDIDDWCVQNSIENFALNQYPELTAEKKQLHEIKEEPYDIILANITRGVHEELMPEYAKRMKPSGQLIMSGFFQEDVNALATRAESFGLIKLESAERQGWARLVCYKQ